MVSDYYDPVTEFNRNSKTLFAPYATFSSSYFGYDYLTCSIKVGFELDLSGAFKWVALVEIYDKAEENVYYMQKAINEVRFQLKWYNDAIWC